MTGSDYMLPDAAGGRVLARMLKTKKGYGEPERNRQKTAFNSFNLRKIGRKRHKRLKIGVTQKYMRMQNEQRET